MRTSEFQEWPFPGTCDLWECSNRDCDYWGGGPSGTRGKCRCVGLRDLCTAHGCDGWPNGQDGYITGMAHSMGEEPSRINPIT